MGINSGCDFPHAKWRFETDKTKLSLTRVDVCMLLHVGLLVEAFAAELAREGPVKLKLFLILIKLKVPCICVD